MLELSIERKQELRMVTRALASDIRLGIIDLLNKKNYNIHELARTLSIPISTAASNVKVLEEAGLLTSEFLPGERGTMKVCKRTFDDMHIKLNNQINEQPFTENLEVEMPVGHFVNCSVVSTCGMAGSSGQMLINEDNPIEFFSPARVQAQIIWFRKGFLEYRFPFEIPHNSRVESIEFSAELCSEAPNYDPDWPSDITLWMNDVELGAWTSPGDLGNRRGKRNPPLWDNKLTQFGYRKVWKIDQNGTTLGDLPLSNKTLSDIGFQNKLPLKVRIGVKEDAQHQGGVNLFGRNFGDFEQDLKMTVFFVR